MLKRLLIVCVLAALPATAGAWSLFLGNHQLTLDLVGTTQYFEFAEFKEYQFPIQGLNWGYRLVDLFDAEHLDPNLPRDPNDPNFYLQNRNVIKMEFVGNLDVGMRLRTAIRPSWGLEAYLKYSPADLVVTYNGYEQPAATFKRYSGVVDPNLPTDFLTWVRGDFPTYHVIRFGLALDYVYFRSTNNTVNGYAQAGLGAITYLRSGELFVPTDYDENTQEWPSAPRDVSYYLPNDTFPSVNAGTGVVLYMHRLFGLNFGVNATYTPFQMERLSGFDSKAHWLLSASIGYAIRFG